MISEVNIDECFGTSDHAIINFTIDLPRANESSSNMTHKRNYNKADWNKMQRTLAEADWDQIFDGGDINDIWLNFKKIFSTSVNSSVPIKLRRSWRIKSNPKNSYSTSFREKMYRNYRNNIKL